MRKEKLLSLLGLGVAFCLAKPHLLYANPTFGGGSGTENDPYQLSTPEHLTELQVAVDGGNSFSGNYFILTNDIDFTGYDNDNNPDNGNFDPIGRYKNHGDKQVFSGNLDGRNYVVSNLEIILPNDPFVGLFVCLEGATISNLNLKNVNLQNQSSVGGLASVAVATTIKNASVSGNVLGDYPVGGLIGELSKSSVIESSAKVDVEGGSYVGGLVGGSYESIIRNSYALGDILGHEYAVGGLIGFTNYSTIEQSFATGTVVGEEGTAGGLIGYDYGGSNILDSYATGRTEGLKYVGGIIGSAYGSTLTDSYAIGDVIAQESVAGGLAGSGNGLMISRSYSKGTIEGNSMVGGLVGHGEMLTIEQSFATESVEGDNMVGGLVGGASQPLVVTDCYSLSNITGNLIVGGLIGSIDDAWESEEVALVKNSYHEGLINGTQTVGTLVGQLGYFNEYDNLWYEGSVSIDNVYFNQERNATNPTIGDSTHGTVTKEGAIGLNTHQMSQQMSKLTMTALDFENIWTTTSTTPMFKWQKDLMSADRGDIQINGNIETLIADVTIPSVSPDLVIDPNLPQGSVSPEFIIENQSTSPIKLDLKTFEQTTNTFNDVLPDKYSSWEGLNKKESKDLALGLIAKEGEGWQRLTTPTSYVAGHTEHEIGVMKPTSTISFEFDVHHGRAFSEAKTVQYRMVFVFDLLN